ncbi:hypothetical protein BC829DRAFT_420696 [Chytridium lagenaria]|nr:hypothetical protein BC829DRAFT_420696 [Chytridium lagenaria]
MLLLPVSFLTTLIVSTCAATLEPPNGRLYLSIAHQEDDLTAGSRIYRDTPQEINYRLGRKIAVFQASQRIPLEVTDAGSKRANIAAIEQTGTDAHAMISLWPNYQGPISATGQFGLSAIRDVDVELLVEQLANVGDFKSDKWEVTHNVQITTGPKSRRVFLRLFPEMNDLRPFEPDFLRPLFFIEQWRRIHQAVQLRGIKELVAFVWSPAGTRLYPTGNFTASDVGVNQTEFSVIDTNGDGIISSLDDSYSPWYPGDTYVDWVGLSFSRLPQLFVTTQFEIFFFQSGRNFYDIYAARKGKPFMVAASRTLFTFTVDDFTPACCSSRLEVLRSYWNQLVTSRSVLDSYPLMKLITISDSRVTANTSMYGDDAVLQAFRTDLNDVASQYIWRTRLAPRLDQRSQTSISASKRIAAAGFGLFVALVAAIVQGF